MGFRCLGVVPVLLLAAGSAHACLFATSTPPEGWYQWASGLFAGEVTSLETDAQKAIDTVTARVVETFKGPEAAGTGTLTVSLSSRYWANCKVERPAIGTRVLVAMNASSEALLVPLSADFAQRLRAHKSKPR